MSATRLRLATENGRRIGRTSKAKRIAAQPATEAARLARALAEIKEEAEKAQARAEAAEDVLKAAFKAVCGKDLIVARALMREALIESPYAMNFRNLIRMCEQAEEGSLCA